MNDDLARQLGALERDSSDALDGPTGSLDAHELRRLKEAARAAFDGATPVSTRRYRGALTGMVALAAAVSLWWAVPSATPRYALQVELVQASPTRGTLCPTCPPSAPAGFVAVLRPIDSDEASRSVRVYATEGGRYRRVDAAVEHAVTGEMRVRGAIDDDPGELLFVVGPTSMRDDDEEVRKWLDDPGRAPRPVIVLRWSRP